MNPESQWIVFTTLAGALLGTLLHNICIYTIGDVVLSTIIIVVAFFVALIMSPSYGEVSKYWKEKYGK